LAGSRRSVERQPCRLGICDGSGWILGPENVARPCDCRSRMVAQARLRGIDSVIPAKYRGVSFDRPPVTQIDAFVVKRVRDFCERLEDNLESGRGMWFFGGSAPESFPAWSRSAAIRSCSSTRTAACVSQPTPPPRSARAAPPSVRSTTSRGLTGAGYARDSMSRRGQAFENPVTGERAVVVTDPAEHPDRVLLVELHVRPGGRVAAPHLHPTLTERFNVLSGRVGFLIGKEEHLLDPGAEAEVPPHTLHDWWQVGDEDARVMVEVNPGDRFVEMVGTMFGLARDGKVNERGIPHLLQLAVTARAYRDVMVIASPPPVVQRVMLGALAPIGRLLGRRPSYEKYYASATTAQISPDALRLVDADGRLRFGGAAVSGDAS
jgi:quercetin dioxygenase-like cupin family protein